MAITERYIVKRPLPKDAVLPPGPRLPAAVQTVLFMAASRTPSVRGGTGATATCSPSMSRRPGGRWSDPARAHPRGVRRPGRRLPRRQGQRDPRPDHGRALAAAAGRGGAPGRPQAGDAGVPRRRAARLGRRSSSSSPRDEVATLAGRTGRSPLHPHMNEISLEVILRIVFGVTDEARLAELRPLLQQHRQDRPADLPRLAVPVRWSGSGRGSRFAAAQGGDRRADLRRDPRAARRRPTSPSAPTCCPSCWPPTPDADATRNCATSWSRCCSPGTRRPRRRWPGRSTSSPATPRLLAPACSAAADEDDDDYLEAVVKESMRLRPVIPRWRGADQAGTVAGYDLPAGVAGSRPSSWCSGRRRCTRPPRSSVRSGSWADAAAGDVDPVRRRHPALPRRGARDGRGAGGAGSSCAGSTSRRSGGRSGRTRNITMVPGRGCSCSQGGRRSGPPAPQHSRRHDHQRDEDRRGREVTADHPVEPDRSHHTAQAADAHEPVDVRAPGCRARQHAPQQVPRVDHRAEQGNGDQPVADRTVECPPVRGRGQVQHNEPAASSAEIRPPAARSSNEAAGTIGVNMSASRLAAPARCARVSGLSAYGASRTRSG